MPYLASQLSAARAESFRWNQGCTPAEYVAKKLRLLRMANITNEDDIVEELHRGFISAPNLHLHLDKYVAARGNSVAEYRSAVGRLQDSARRESDMPLAHPRPGTRRPLFRESVRTRTQLSDARLGTPASATAITSAQDAMGSAPPVSGTSSRKTPRERL